MPTYSKSVRKPAGWFLNGFHRFLRPFLRRHFHSIAIDRASRIGLDAAASSPLIVYANHPSWWDPLVAHYLHRTLLSGRSFYAPIDAAALQQYRVFEKLGFYGVQLASLSGAAAFLKQSASILSDPNAAIWITPEGRFADVRDHSVPLMPGLAHLCSRHSNVVALPLALEYAFWNERLPVCLASWGNPIKTSDHPEWSKSDWTRQLSDGLRSAQLRLAELSMQRSSEPFDNLLRGVQGGGWFYDSFRRVKSFMTGLPFKAGHGDQFQ